MAHDIVNLYFDTHFPHAIEWAAQLRKAGGPAQLRFMTQSYLVSLFMSCPAGMGLHCPNATYVEQFKVCCGCGYGCSCGWAMLAAEHGLGCVSSLVAAAGGRE